MHFIITNLDYLLVKSNIINHKSKEKSCFRFPTYRRFCLDPPRSCCVRVRAESLLRTGEDSAADRSLRDKEGFTGVAKGRRSETGGLRGCDGDNVTIRGGGRAQRSHQGDDLYAGRFIGFREVIVEFRVTQFLRRTNAKC